MAILIKRYANRKLYNTESSRYITLKGIAKLLEDGEEVRVIDNETGEDITQVALSQILVDNQRAHEDPSDTLLSQILSRGGDALYGAIRKSVDDATDGLGEFQDRFRRIVNQSEPGFRVPPGFPWERRSGEAASSASRDEERGGSDASDRAVTQELDRVIRSTMVEVLESFELPRRRDIEGLARNIERVAVALERLESRSESDSNATLSPTSAARSREES
jgi:polyhydroxyalkanoate synthesis repressor PhaR